MHLKLYAILIFLGYSSFLHAQEWSNYNITNSLISSNQIHAIHIDRDDNKWIATANGLIRIEGVNWHFFNKLNANLPSNFITAIDTDNSNNVWVGTEKGLMILNNNIWESNLFFENEFILKIKFDVFNNKVFVATKKGLFTKTGDEWTHFAESDLYFDNEIIQSVLSTRDGTVWVGTFDHYSFQGRLWYYNGLTWKRLKLENFDLASCFPTSLFLNDKNELLSGIKGTMGGYLVKIKTDHIEIINNDQNKCLISGVNQIVYDRNEVWMATGNGIISVSKTKFCENLNSNNSSLSHDYVSSIAIDKIGNKWIGTIGGGLFIYNKNGIIINQDGLINSEEILIYPTVISNSATICFNLNKPGNVRLEIYNTLGLKIKILENKFYNPGIYSFAFDNSMLPNGIYICQMRQNGISKSVKFIVK